MCGRFNLSTHAAAWTQDFLPLWSADEVAEKIAEYAIAARYNIAPTQDIACILAGDNEKRQWSMFRWGLVPHWAKDAAIGNRMINARSETADQKRSFKDALARRRCLIPADGYYEWTKTAAGKQPYLIRHVGDNVLAMAGLWECNQKIIGPDQPLYSCTILTTSANETTAEIHDRMPVLLDQDQQSVWLDNRIEDAESLHQVMHPAPNDWLSAYPVSTMVNSPRNDGPQCAQPIEITDRADRPEPPDQPSLF